MQLSDFLLPCIYAGLSSTGFCLIFNVRKVSHLFFASVGGAIGWAAYLVTIGQGSDLISYFLATIAISIYAEIMARCFKAPATIFLLAALMPMVPGGGIFYTMEHCINGDTAAFLETGLHTLAIAGSLAMGILVVSALARLAKNIGMQLCKPRSAP